MLRAQAAWTSRKSPSSRMESTTVCTSYGFIGSSGTAPASSSQRRSALSAGAAPSGAFAVFIRPEEGQGRHPLGHPPPPPAAEAGSARLPPLAEAAPQL